MRPLSASTSNSWPPAQALHVQNRRPRRRWQMCVRTLCFMIYVVNDNRYRLSAVWTSVLGGSRDRWRGLRGPKVQRALREAGNGREDLISGFGPHEGFEIRMLSVDELPNGGFELRDAAVRSTAQLLVRQFGSARPSSARSHRSG